MFLKARYLFAVIILNCLLVLPALAAETTGSPGVASGFRRFFIDGGMLVLFILLPLSLVTISLIVQFFLVVRRSKIIPANLTENIGPMIANAQFKNAMVLLESEDNFLGHVLHTGLAEAKNGRNTMETAMGEMLEQDTTTLLRRIEWLNIIGNVAPMIGLFGTVWGMIDAFNGIVQAGGQPESTDLAGGISTALVTTWWGMIVAIPALAAYGVLRNRIDSLSAQVAVTSEDLLRDISTRQ